MARTSKLVSAGFTADGVNGVSGNRMNESLKTVAKGTTSSSMQAEAQQTTERELEDEYDSDGDLDQAGALLEGFDSDTEGVAQDEGFDKNNPTAALPNYKKTQKKLKQAAQKGKKEGPGAVYVGRIPHGFYETEMRQYFSQFGTITKLRLSRNRKTGHSKHFAFLEFESTEVAKIVAETMDNYLMFGHILKCKYVPSESLHPEVFKGANKRFRVAPRNRMEKRALEAPKTESHWMKKNEKEQAKREKKAEKLKEMGYEFELPKLKSPKEALQQKHVQIPTEEKAPELSETEEKEVLAPNAVPKDGVVMTKKKSRREKKEKTAPAEPIGALIQSTTAKEQITDFSQVQHSQKPGPEEHGKRREKRETAKGKKVKGEKAKDGISQPATQLTTEETTTKETEAVNGGIASTEAESAQPNRKAKPRNRRKKAGTGQQSTRDEPPSIAATPKTPTAAVEETDLSPSVPISTTINDGQSKKTRRKRKHPELGDDLAESSSKSTKVAPSNGKEKEQDVHAAVGEADPSPSVPISTVNNDTNKKTRRKRKHPETGDDPAGSTSKSTEVPHSNEKEKEQEVNGRESRTKGILKKARKA